jgi:hypothetical protein
MDYLTVNIIISITGFIVWIYFLYLQKSYKLKKFFKNFPTPPTQPFLGNAGDFSTTSGNI